MQSNYTLLFPMLQENIAGNIKKHKFIIFFKNFAKKNFSQKKYCNIMNGCFSFLGKLYFINKGEIL